MTVSPEMRVEIAFEDWIVGVFDPTVEDPWPPPAQDLSHLTRLFSDPVGSLEGLSDEETCPAAPSASGIFRSRAGGWR